MDHGHIFRNNEVAIFIELHGNLLVYQKNIMHFFVKIRITFFAVIPDFKRLNISSVQQFLQHWFCESGQPWKTSFFCIFLNVLMKIFQSPKFL